jgi:DNA-directed RNA polymerase subunit RPC12/RpoP
MKCSRCGFEAPVQEWRMVEKSGFCKLPEEFIKDYERWVDTRTDVPLHLRILGKAVFRALAMSGMMPYHTTSYVCPKCGGMVGD